MCAAASTMWFSDRYGFGATTALGAGIQCIGLAIASARPPFPVFAIAYLLGGFGVALLDAQANSMLTVLPTNQHAKMMLGHGFYGFGAFVAPLVSTQFAQPTTFMLKHWSFHYLVGLGLGLVNLTTAIAVYRFRNEARMSSVYDSTFTSADPSLLRQKSSSLWTSILLAINKRQTPAVLQSTSS